MELIILLFLLSSMNKDARLQDTLRSFLGFYKENRELITMLMSSQGQNVASPTHAQAEPEQTTSKQTESRPSEKVGQMNLLEEYLKRYAV